MNQPHSISRDEVIRRFEAYYDTKWVPMHDYFGFHKQRFLHSVEFLHQFVAPESHVADLVQPGDGPGPLAEFFSIDKNSDLTLITTDLRERLDVADSSCDLVLCTETIEHIKDKESTEIADLERFNYSGVDNMLSEIARILRPEGMLFITTPNSSSFTNLYKWLMGELPYMDANHVREYTVDLLNETCGRNGFIPVEIELRNSWGNVGNDLLADFEQLLASFPVKRDVSRNENIYALYRKGPECPEPEVHSQSCRLEDRSIQ
jgi:SAM-dependent methyltransferase